MKRSQRPIGNLPLEILTYLAAFADELVTNGQLPIPMTQSLLCMP
jgi:ion channel-forming bestrophin family protein